MNKTTLLEALRHVLHRTSLDRVLMRRRMSRGQDIGHLQAPDRARVFSYIYDRGLWRNGDSHGPLSGVGSELQATDGLRNELSALLASLPARSILDVGCGDFTWMQHVDLSEMKYVGVDIVPTVMEANKKAFGSASREFILLDAVTDRLPTCDVVLCREVLFHLSFADGQRLLENIRMSGALNVLLTSDTGTAFNADIKTGDFRILNLQKRPYRLRRRPGYLTERCLPHEVSRCGAARTFRLPGLLDSTVMRRARRSVLRGLNREWPGILSDIGREAPWRRARAHPVEDDVAGTVTAASRAEKEHVSL